jgi:hypothetical protein
LLFQALELLAFFGIRPEIRSVGLFFYLVELSAAGRSVKDSSAQRQPAGGA